VASAAGLARPAAGKAVDWRCLLASPQFRRLFSDESKKSAFLLLCAVFVGFAGPAF